jgi:signal transduction histidine kinase
LKTDARKAHFPAELNNAFLSCLAIPLMAKEELLGFLSFYTQQAHEFGRDEVEFLTARANQVAVAIHNSRLYERMRKQAIELEKSNKLKDEFLSVVSHELRTPLSIVMGYTRMVHTGMLGEINAEQADALARATTGSNELCAMIESIMDVTKIVARTITVDNHAVDLTRFVQELEAEYGDRPEKAITLQWDYASDMPAIETDHVKLKRVVQNLIDNAIKFTPEGQVTVSVCYILERRSVEIQVKDTGVGISADALPFVFEKFRQAEDSLTREHGGLGLGLYVAKELIALLGGTITVESQLGVGSTFTVTFPAVSPERMVA